MKSFIVVCLFGFAALAVARYTDKYDKINLDEILENRRVLLAYVNCLFGTGKCSPEAKELQLHIQDALENHCADCTDAQKDGTKKVIKHLINKEPEIWKQLCDKYDPKRVYATKYEEELREVSA